MDAGSYPSIINRVNFEGFRSSALKYPRGISLAPNVQWEQCLSCRNADFQRVAGSGTAQ
jgi:hypothetical protein